MNRRSFFASAVSALGIFGLARVFKMDSSWAQVTKVKGKPAGGVGLALATDDSLKGLPKAAGLNPSNFFDESDKPATVQNFCNASVSGNKTCGPKRQPGQFCGSCTFLQERVAYDGNVAGKCQLIPPKPPKSHVHGNYYCASYVPNPSNKYEIKG
jgi:hypothetical protein